MTEPNCGWKRVCQHEFGAEVGMVLEVAGVGSYGFYNFAVIVTVPTLRNQMKNPKKPLGRLT